MTARPLRGIRVVDFSWVMAGPTATRILGAQGAEVVKIESTRRAEFARNGGYTTVLNNSKRSCTLDFTTAEGRALLRRLIASSDVVIENFSAGVLGKYELDYAHVREIRPDVIFVSSSGVGRTGPQRDVVAYGSLLQAFSGRSALINEPNGDLEAMGINPAWTDPMTGLWAAFVVVAALYHRRRTGEGAYIDLSMLESTVALTPEALIRETLRGEPPPGGNRENDAAPGGCFRCAGGDAWLALAVRDDAEWRATCAVIERPDLAADTRYADRSGRRAHRAELDAVLAAWLATRPAEAVERAFTERGVPAARSRSVADIMEDPHFAARGLFPTMADGRRTIALPWLERSSGRGTSVPTPALGADNDYVFGELLGLGPAEIAELSAKGVIA